MSHSIASAVRLAVTAIVLTGCAWLAPGLQLCAEMAVLTDPRGVAIAPDGSLLAACGGEKPRVLRFSRAGELLGEIGTGRLTDPWGVAADAQGRILLCDPGRGEVMLLAPDGTPVRAAGGFSGARWAAIGPQGRVYVADTGANRIVVLDGELSAPLFSFGVVALETGGDGTIRSPSGIASSGGTLAVLDSGSRILILPAPSAAGGEIRARAVTAPDLEAGALALTPTGRLYAAGAGRIRGFAADGSETGSFRASAVRLWFEPRGIAVDPAGNVLAADGSTRRILGTTADLFDEMPAIGLDPADPSTAVVEWTTAVLRPTFLRWGPTEDCGSEEREAVPVTKHRVVLRSLKPSARYFVHVGDPVEAIPPVTPPRADLALDTQRRCYRILSLGNFSGEFPFATHPPVGRAEWVSLPVIVAVYRRVVQPQDAAGARPPDRILDEADLAVLRAEMETYRLWAWRHSSLKLNLDFHWILVEEPRDHAQLGDITPVVLEDIRRGLSARGESPDGFWSAIIVGTHGWYANYLAGTVAGSQHELGACYTGFGHGTKPGWWWFPVHEHGHLIHSMVMCSWAGSFGFPDAPWTLPGKFGEDFSFMAFNYRQFPPRGWLLLKRTEIGSSVDEDRNGVPDDDPAVPLDQRRFGWKPEMGGDCRQRIMAGLRMPGFAGGTDMDFEGRVHRLNDGEPYWVDRKAPRGAPVIDGRLLEGEWREFSSIPNLTTPQEARGLRAKLFLAWDAGRLCVAVKSSAPVVLGIDLDGANNGWFHGRDNLRISVRRDGPLPGARADGAIWDFLGDRLNDHDGQLWYRGAYKEGDIRAAAGEEGGWHVLECAVPARPEIGIAPARGARFAIRATLTADPPGSGPSAGFFDGEDFIYDIECVGE